MSSFHNAVPSIFIPSFLCGPPEIPSTTRCCAKSPTDTSLNKRCSEFPIENFFCSPPRKVLTKYVLPTDSSLLKNKYISTKNKILEKRDFGTGKIKDVNNNVAGSKIVLGCTGPKATAEALKFYVYPKIRTIYGNNAEYLTNTPSSSKELSPFVDLNDQSLRLSQVACYKPYVVYYGAINNELNLEDGRNELKHFHQPKEENFVLFSKRTKDPTRKSLSVNLQDECKRLENELQSAKIQLENEKQTSKLYEEAYNDFIKSLINILHDFDNSHEYRVSRCTEENQMKTLFNFSRTLNVTLKHAFPQYSDNILCNEDAQNKTLPAIDLPVQSNKPNENESQFCALKMEEDVKQNLKTQPCAQDDDDDGRPIQILDSQRSKTSSRSYTSSLYSNYVDIKEKDINKISTGPLSIPKLSLNMAGKGSWLTGEKEPDEYPKGF